jgi:uncharacterized protein with HEPN domain
VEKTVHIRLQDILDAIDGIRETVSSVTYEEFARSWTMLRAVERGLEIISESSRSVPLPLKEKTASIPWAQIAAIGNVLRHEYQRVEPLIVWNIVHDDLDDLYSAIFGLIKTLP